MIKKTRKHSDSFNLKSVSISRATYTEGKESLGVELGSHVCEAVAVRLLAATSRCEQAEHACLAAGGGFEGLHAWSFLRNPAKVRGTGGFGTGCIESGRFCPSKSARFLDRYEGWLLVIEDVIGDLQENVMSLR